MKKVVLLVLAVVLGGCATPPGQINDNRFKWSEMTLEVPVDQVRENLIHGFRECSDVQPITSSYRGKSIIDVYLPSGLLQTRSNYAYGRIEIADINSKTQIKIGVLNSVDNPLIGKKGHHRRLWEQWSKGSTQCD